MKNEMALNAAGGKASPAASPADVLARAAGKVLAPLSRYYSGVLGTKVSARQTLLLVNAQAAFAMAKRTALPRQCRECRWLFACNGECPKNRFLHTKEGEPGLNYLCKGYKKFFAHVAPYMDFMKKELLAQRPPANVMQWARENNPIE